MDLRIYNVAGGIDVHIDREKYYMHGATEAKRKGRFVLVKVPDGTAVLSSKCTSHKIFDSVDVFGNTGIRVVGIRNNTLFILNQKLEVIAQEKLVQFNRYVLQSVSNTDKDGKVEIVLIGYGMFGKSDVEFYRYNDKKRSFV